MNCIVTNDNSVTVAKIIGDLDHHTAKFIRGEIDKGIKETLPHRLILDFSHVTFMDSSGIGLVMGRYKLMGENGGEVLVANPPDYIKKVFKLAGIDKLTKIVGDYEKYLDKEQTKADEKNIDKEELKSGEVERVETKIN